MELFIAIFLPQAFPAIVTPATTADMINCETVSELICVSVLTAITADAEPETTPQISPTLAGDS